MEPEVFITCSQLPSTDLSPERLATYNPVGEACFIPVWIYSMQHFVKHDIRWSKSELEY
jgi:hypothetical protein